MGYPAMDPVTGVVTIVGLQTVGKKAVDVVGDFLAKLITPTAEAAGTTLASPIREWHRRRLERARALLLDAAGMVAEHRKKPQPVPGRILMPILEKGSLEDDRSLRRTWSRLLASAAMPSPDVPVLAAFPHILAELTPLEVKILAYVMEECEEHDSRLGKPIACNVFRSHKIKRRFRINAWMCATIRDNLVRLNLLSVAWSELDRAGSDVSAVRNPYLATTLAYALYDACIAES